MKNQMIPDIDGVWKIEQLTAELHNIVNEYMEYFNGLIPEEN